MSVLCIRSPLPEPSWGVFETLLVVGGKPLELERHLARLQASVTTLYGSSLPPDLRERLLGAAADADLARMRATVTPDGGGSMGLELLAVDIDEAIVFPPWERGVDLVPVRVPGWNGAHKWADRRLVEQAEADTDPARPLLVDADDTLLEGSRGNLFLVRDGVLLTPPADGRVLPGVTRARLIELAGELGVAVREEPLAFERLAEADEVLLTGAVRGVEHVRRCEGAGEWRAGEVTDRLAAELRRAWFK